MSQCHSESTSSRFSASEIDHLHLSVSESPLSRGGLPVLIQRQRSADRPPPPHHPCSRQTVRSTLSTSNQRQAGLSVRYCPPGALLLSLATAPQRLSEKHQSQTTADLQTATLRCMYQAGASFWIEPGAAVRHHSIIGANFMNQMATCVPIAPEPASSLRCL